ncbi:extracellular solute-binding protein [Xinfangfangia sp. D13-10-4-6]|uniref:ABC transporter substrate-binding protein n=1 Tax=Pseudogemmobacter hezensis TaxID=2737662 RepID=UPI001551998F|nr:extracellular solute-binding protein [Pseudogemmobacter hezensis]NPD16749.1 extracellular solute-binding protein [Pseudogemmobacter hezensis]
MKRSGRLTPPGAFSRRQFSAMSLGGLAAFAASPLMMRAAHAAGTEIAFWGTGTLDIGDAWAQTQSDIGLSVNFTDNGNDPGPIVARLVAGNANAVYDLSGLQGGAEKELAKQGAIVPWDTSKIANWDKVWQWAKDIPYLTDNGQQIGIPCVVNADSIIYRKDKLGLVDSYGVIFDPKLKGRVAMEDAWINSAIFAAIYLKGAENAPINDPGNLTEDELGLVMEFLIKHKRDGQFRTFWNGWEQGVQLVADEEVDAMTGWEPIVLEGQRRGLDVAYAEPVEGYEGWGNNLLLHKGAVDRGLGDAAHQLANWIYDGFYGAQLALSRGYVVPSDKNTEWAAGNLETAGADQVKSVVDHVAKKFSGKVYWQNTRPDNFQLYEEWWQKLRNS